MKHTLTKEEEKKFEKEFPKNYFWILDPKLALREKRKVKRYIATLKHNAVKKERESWINQPANEHDERIRKAERERITTQIRNIVKDGIIDRNHSLRGNIEWLLKSLNLNHYV